jgi:hypothetical protein
MVRETTIRPASTVKNIARTGKANMASLEKGKKYEHVQVIRRLRIRSKLERVVLGSQFQASYHTAADISQITTYQHY